MIKVSTRLCFFVVINDSLKVKFVGASPLRTRSRISTRWCVRPLIGPSHALNFFFERYAPFICILRFDDMLVIYFFIVSSDRCRRCPNFLYKGNEKIVRNLVGSGCFMTRIMVLALCTSMK